MDLRNIYKCLDIPLLFTLVSAVAMGLAICHHLPTLPNGGIIESGVPWFFFASGFWYGRKPRDYKKELGKRVKSLLVPYYLWNICWFPILFVANWIGWRYCGVERAVDGSLATIIRCLGFNPCQWPALVPTWFLRALFVAVVTVGGLWSLGTRLKKLRHGEFAWRVTVALLFICVYATRKCWMLTDPSWDGFFIFGVPLRGMMCFAVGGMVAMLLDDYREMRFKIAVRLIRRQMMPIYVIHAIVIMICGWVAKAIGCFDGLATIQGDIVMWFVGIIGAIAIGESIRLLAPNAARVLFGGR